MTMLYLTQGADRRDDEEKAELCYGDGTGGELSVFTVRPGVLKIDIEGGAMESGQAILSTKQVQQLRDALDRWLADSSAGATP